MHVETVVFETSFPCLSTSKRNFEWACAVESFLTLRLSNFPRTQGLCSFLHHGLRLIARYAVDDFVTF